MTYTACLQASYKNYNLVAEVVEDLQVKGIHDLYCMSAGILQKL